MANPADPGTFENWLADVVPMMQARPKTGDTGTMEYWIADTMSLAFYTNTPAVAAGQPTMRRWGGVPGMAAAPRGRTW